MNTSFFAALFYVGSKKGGISMMGKLIGAIVIMFILVLIVMAVTGNNDSALDKLGDTAKDTIGLP